MPKRIPVEAKRVPLNCLVLPETLAWLKSLEGSQGGGVDLAVAAFRMQESRGHAPVPVAYVQDEPRRSKLNKRERVAQELAASDVTAQIVDRQDIEYGHHETLPRGEHVANWRRGPREPLLKPSEKKK